ncbi:MAG TPA: hypothetical protein DCP90_07205 [Clostridiales bacterium]|nr:MAG: hypothetical protein A2Y22_02485 [Clostridiales bacterium GWD2_32_59]HAN10384.1 hypothetical protein [Clostridiales bacterium]
MIGNKAKKIIKMLVYIGIACIAINFETVGIAKAEAFNIVIPAKNTVVPLPQVTNIWGDSGNLDSARGYVVLHWTPVSEATGYKVHVYDGYQYRGFDVGNVTKWDSRVAKIYPPESTLTSKGSDSATEDLFLHGKVGLDLMNSPANLYKATQGLEYNSKTNYMFRVTSYRKSEESAIDFNAGYIAQLIKTPNDTTEVVTPTPTTNEAEKLTAEIVSTLAADLGSVTIKCSGIGGKGEVTEIRKPDGTIWKGNNLEYTVYDNGEYYFTIVDNIGRETIAIAKVAGIQVKPLIVALNINNKTTANLNFSRNDAIARYTNFGYNWDIEPTVMSEQVKDGKANILVTFVGTKKLHIKFKNAEGKIKYEIFEITITEGTNGQTSVSTKRL